MRRVRAITLRSAGQLAVASTIWAISQDQTVGADQCAGADTGNDWPGAGIHRLVIKHGCLFDVVFVEAHQRRGFFILGL